MSVTSLIYRAAGSPTMAGDLSGLCRTCGETGVGVYFGDWVKDGFTNHDTLYTGEIVCNACLFCFEEKSLVLQEKTGRDKPQKFRTYSHFVVDEQWFALSKADKPKMRKLLARNPEVVVIADSGQRHLAFRARPGWWQFEELSLMAGWDKVAPLIKVFDELLIGGFSKSEIETGDYNLYRVDKFGVTRWRELAQPLYRTRRSPYFQLALFLAQKAEA